MTMTKRDARKRLFAAYYIGEANFNATEAVILAGYECSSRKSATSLGTQLMQDQEVQNMIAEHIEKAEMSQAEMLEELVSLARWDHTDDPVLYGIEANAHAKLYDTKMRAKITALDRLLKNAQTSNKQKLDQLTAAFLQHKQKYPDMDDAARADMFKKHGVDAAMVDDMLKDLMRKAENRRLAAEAEAQIAEPMLEGAE